MMILDLELSKGKSKSKVEVVVVIMVFQSIDEYDWRMITIEFVVGIDHPGDINI